MARKKQPLVGLLVLRAIANQSRFSLWTLYIGNVAFPGIRVIGDEKSQDAILGRDILNKLPLFLDGIQQQTMVLDDTVVQRLRSR